MRENTKLSLESESDPATILHLTLTLLFCQATGLILNSPGRCVPNILEHLKPSISSETFAKLIHFQSKPHKDIFKERDQLFKINFNKNVFQIKFLDKKQVLYIFF